MLLNSLRGKAQLPTTKKMSVVMLRRNPGLNQQGIVDCAISQALPGMLFYLLTEELCSLY